MREGTERERQLWEGEEWLGKDVLERGEKGRDGGGDQWIRCEEG